MKITTRAEAAANNEKYYYTGKLCANRHLYKRTVSDGHCLQCDAERRKVVRDKRKKLADVASAEHQAIRQTAKDNKEVTYNTGEKCSMGHNSDRYTASQTCVECLAENSIGFRQRRRYDRSKKGKPQNKSITQKREHAFEPSALDYIEKRQLSVVKIKRKRRKCFVPEDSVHLGPMNNYIETFE